MRFSPVGSETLASRNPNFEPVPRFGGSSWNYDSLRPEDTEKPQESSQNRPLDSLSLDRPQERPSFPNQDRVTLTETYDSVDTIALSAEHANQSGVGAGTGAGATATTITSRIGVGAAAAAAAVAGT